ncbi:uncharacterized protein LOC117641992 [Thrips palmi]|uniref:Uncharacterized protein LOC117641992 n=1 Tax=Thrips palmi TaxID=161013 RepID=A0A6P8ZJM3_THRPL|nr:uncharacterized protein LOC117641992 [Thrips palmi]
MMSTSINNSSFLDPHFNKVRPRNATIKNNGDEEFMKWMSSMNPKLLSKYPAFSKESQAKLRSLYTFNLQTDSTVDDIIKNMNRSDSEYEALALKTSDHLQRLHLGDDEELSCDTQQALLEKGSIVVQGNLGDGSDVGAVATLAVDFLAQSNTSRQKLGLVKDIQLLRRRNERLRENSKYFGRELKLATEEVASQQTFLENLIIDLNVSQSNLSKLNQTLSSTKAELNERGVTPAISNQAIMDAYQDYITLQNEINCLKGKLSKYGDLPCSVTEASKVISSKKQHLDALSNELKNVLASYYSKH